MNDAMTAAAIHATAATSAEGIGGEGDPMTDTARPAPARPQTTIEWLAGPVLAILIIGGLTVAVPDTAPRAPTPVPPPEQIGAEQYAALRDAVAENPRLARPALDAFASGDMVDVAELDRLVGSPIARQTRLDLGRARGDFHVTAAAYAAMSANTGDHE